LINYLEDLNEQQKEAVLYNEGPLLVFAGAGSGKTKVITYKIAYIIDALQVLPSRILAVTFTNKAAQEMKERTEKLIGTDIQGLWIGTFHSMCARILRNEIRHLGYKGNFSILDEEDSVRVIRDVMKSLNIDPKYLDPKAIKNSISKAKIDLVDSMEFRRIAYEYFDKVVSSIYVKYEESLKSSNCLDFDDLLTLTVKLFRENEEVSYHYKNKFKYVLVDEFQDVNKTQYELIKILSSKHRRVTVVGDDDQSIYSFRGANVGFIDLIFEDFPETKTVKLERNYRSPQEILDAANILIKHNRSRSNKTLYCDKKIPDSVNFYEALDEIDEARFVAKKIKQLLENESRSYSEFAVLYRTNSQSRMFEEFFVNAGIPYQVVGGLKFYSRAEIKDIIEYLNLINNNKDNISLKRIINVPSRKIGDQTFKIIEEVSTEKNISFFESIEYIINSEENSTKKQLKEFYEMILDFSEKAKILTLTRLVEEILSATNYYNYLAEKYREEAETKVENLREFVNMVSEFSKQTENPTLDGLLTQISLITDIDEVRASSRVLMMTLHLAKGLEFPVVFLTGMEEGYLPHFRSLESENDIEEERRLCYVGVTRAIEKVFLTYAARRSKFGMTGPTKPSRFLTELNVTEITTTESIKPELTLNAGDKVLHRVWGLGSVIEVHFDTDIPYAVVEFLKIGRKKLDLRYAPLEKVK
jgi:DNA helicase-2/ATP-dependent DNA helicase PcrA